MTVYKHADCKTPYFLLDFIGIWTIIIPGALDRVKASYKNMKTWEKMETSSMPTSKATKLFHSLFIFGILLTSEPRELLRNYTTRLHSNTKLVVTAWRKEWVSPNWSQAKLRRFFYLSICRGREIKSTSVAKVTKWRSHNTDAAECCEWQLKTKMWFFFRGNLSEMRDVLVS